MSDRQKCGTKNYCTLLGGQKKLRGQDIPTVLTSFFTGRSEIQPPGSRTQDLWGLTVTPKIFTASCEKCPEHTAPDGDS